MVQPSQNKNSVPITIKDADSNLKPFLKWAGGKSGLLNEIMSQLPEKIKHGTIFNYIEPFIGSGAVLFRILQLYGKQLNKVIISDINDKLINVYRVTRDFPSGLTEKLEILKKEYLSLTGTERKIFYYEKRDEYNKISSEENNIDRAALFILLNKLCYNGLYRENSSGDFNVPYGKYKNPQIFDKKLIFSISKAIEKVDILNTDYENTLKLIDDKLTLYYLDPPYKPISNTSTFNSYSKFNFNDKEQERLKLFCDKLTKRNIHFILSNSDLKNTDSENHYFDNLYRDYKIKRVSARRSINCNASERGEIRELLISN
jgi:DNA adenine methylase